MTATYKYDTESELKIYINGSVVAAYTNANGPMHIDADSIPLTIGATLNSISAPQYPLRGARIDGFKLFNRTLTRPEIVTLYYSQK